ncbi:GTP cyclohydrolase II [Nocardia iowensis]|uniref:GTP cyclohydrolase II n=1 Tax=Nocardia iowensis TaxID=204891 RepID=A0ABX8RLC7_NOCIO|nr:GTP cyclohydrolase II [Nocardia iowensis]QXN88246.1 GTP cyclohydrolase II [Nocardia iowensis]
MTTPVSSLADTDHRFTRKGHDLQVRVLDLADDREHGHLLVFGDVADGCLVRVHSRCLYGEALRSDDCDCGAELDVALDLIQAAGSGVLVYLEQEGRGVGLIAKARGYRESERAGTDTFASYEALGYPADARTYDVAAQGLLALGLQKVELLTNNPAKREALERAGIAVTVRPLHTRVLSERARDYLEAKRRRRQHWIPTDAPPWAVESVPVIAPEPQLRPAEEAALTVVGPPIVDEVA